MAATKNPMKRLVLTLIVTVCMPTFVVGQVVEEIITRVNGQIITRSEFLRSKEQLKEDVKQQDPANADARSSTGRRCAG